MTQGEFQPSTRRGLFSLTMALVVLGVLLYSGRTLVHLHLPPGN
jgi:hypothetical protein